MKRILFLLLLIIGSRAFGQLQLINVGTAANTGKGDPARTAFIKTNAAITQLNRIGILTITASGAEINILDGALVNTTELNRLVGVTSAVQTQLNAKLNKTDTATMLSKYLRIADTAGMGGGASYDTTYLYQVLNGKLAIGDTADMLDPYAKLSDLTEGGISLSAVQDEIADSLDALRPLVVMVEDTANMLLRYINKADTAAMLADYINKADTAAMLSKYLRIADTAGMGGGISQAEVSDIVHDSITTYLQNADPGIDLADSTGYGEGNYVTRKALVDSISAAVDEKLSISDTTNMLADYINKADTADMLIKYRRITDITPWYTFGAGTGAAADSTLFAKGCKSFGSFRVIEDSLYAYSFTNIYMTSGDSIKMNVYIGNGMTRVATDSLFTAPQGIGHHVRTITPNNTRTIPKDKDIWIGIIGPQPANTRPKEWVIQLNAKIVRD